MKTLHRSLLVTALLAALALPAQAVQLVVWDPQLQTKLGYGEATGNKFNLQLVTDYSGPVVAIFTRDDSEKNSYAGLMPRYNGQLTGGTLSLFAGGTLQPLNRFLGTFKLTPSVQNSVRTFSLPGLKTAPSNK